MPRDHEEGGGPSLTARRRPRAARSWLWWLPLAVMAVDVSVEAVVHSREPVSFMLTGVPPLAAATRGPRATAGFTAVCIALEMGMAARRAGHFAEQHHVALYCATLVVGAASVALSAQRVRAQASLIHARTVAEAMQFALLRPVPRTLGPLSIAGHYAAGEGGTLVGGDLYEICETPFGVRAIIGDVRGKGLDAVQTVSAVLGSFRVSAHEWQDLSQLAERLELSIARNSPAAPTADGELFCTALLLEFPPGAGEVRIVDRGHPPPVLIGGSGARWLPTAPSLPLGLGELSPKRAEITVHPLRPGELVVTYTDGVSEARNESGEFYPVLDRVSERFGGRLLPDPAAVVSFVRADAERWSAGADTDDQAMLAIRTSAADERRRGSPR
ncbi:PP2C family protein-serine/threonine phosphatase [Streptomyces sp. NPDC051907]|uniref:PP2C family protein-serine/threonine phosphatase n=1 Tax=Streptomyces sp. NPDC051907 TaxID=3155284 RepID=UPI0034491449